MTTVGRWMSQAEYAAMKNGSPAAVGAGGKTSVTVGGPNVWSSAKPVLYMSNFKFLQIV